MKTTLEIPDPLFRRAKSEAARQGIPLRKLVEEALTDELRGTEPEAKPWMKGFGKLRHLRHETARISRITEDEFEQIEPEDLQRSWTRMRYPHSPIGILRFCPLWRKRQKWPFRLSFWANSNMESGIRVTGPDTSAGWRCRFRIGECLQWTARPPRLTRTSAANSNERDVLYPRMICGSRR